MCTANNVIILGAGHSGTSVIAGLLTKLGYWPGEDTVKLPDYDTYENSLLVSLNKQLLSIAGVDSRYMRNTPLIPYGTMKSIAESKDRSKYDQFLAMCNCHRPWVWKDPRLCVTLDFWSHFLELRQCKVVVVTRDLAQSWTGTILRAGMMISYPSFVDFCQRMYFNLRRFIARHEPLRLHHLHFEDVLLSTQIELQRLSSFLGNNVSFEAFEGIYCGTPGRKRWQKWHFHLAQLTYLLTRFPRPPAKSAVQLLKVRSDQSPLDVLRVHLSELRNYLISADRSPGS